jgi:predicted XRE-type DNA-binding protein
MARAKNNVKVRQSSGNVFADLGLKDASEKKTKVRLAVEINHILEKARFSQSSAAKRLGINQPKFLRYRITGSRAFPLND